MWKGQKVSNDVKKNRSDPFCPSLIPSARVFLSKWIIHAFILLEMLSETKTIYSMRQKTTPLAIDMLTLIWFSVSSVR